MLITAYDALPAELIHALSSARRVTVFSGAGMSAESGLATFRDKATGLWSHVDPTALASIEAWHEDPEPQWAWYLWRARLAAQAQPNAGHRAIADWAQTAELTVVTQNIDDLHERAGSAGVIHLHGQLTAWRGSSFATPYPDVELPEEDMPRLTPPACPHCGKPVRPGVVWFGEALPQAAWDAAQRAVTSCDLLVVVGTSGVVYPAAQLPLLAQQIGIDVLEISPEDTALSEYVRWSWRTTAARGLPELLDHLPAD